MSSLIILPGASPAYEGPLAGRVLMLNTDKAPKVQSYGFIVTRNAPIQVVPATAQEGPLRAALADGRLTDVTGTEASAGATGKIMSDIDKAVKARTMSLVKEGEEIGPRVMTGKDPQGNTYFITPKNEADYERMQEEIRTTGTLRVERPKPTSTPGSGIFGGLGRIYEEELPSFIVKE